MHTQLLLPIKSVQITEYIYWPHAADHDDQAYELIGYSPH